MDNAMLDKEPLFDLLRTHSVSKYLVRRSRNRYVSLLRELLNELGYGKELNWSRLGADAFFGEETAAALRSFASRNRLQNDGLSVDPEMLLRMLMRFDAVDGLKLLQRSQQNQQLGLAFNLNDPNNFGAQQLRLLLENMGIYEENLQIGLRAYAQQKGMYSDGKQMTDPLARALIADLLPGYGPNFVLPANDVVTTPVTPLPTTPSRSLEIVVSTNTVMVSDGVKQIQFRRHAPTGVSTPGYLSIEKFVLANQDKLQELDLTQSALAVITAVAQNEGHLDGINTYDQGYLSFGVYQWTLGKAEKGGELPALLKKVKTLYPATFKAFFTDHGLDVSEDTNTTYGFLTYNNELVSAAYLKDQFREPTWAFRFWRAGQEANVQAVQVEHAISRLNNFYWKPNYAAFGFTLNQLVTSSYGVALLLDNHVNRPAWVAKCVTQAMTDTGLTANPELWTDAEEQRLIQAYLAIREVYREEPYQPMSESRRRADKIFSKVREGKLSDRRGSFQMREVALRSYNYPEAYDALVAKTPNAVPPPVFYDPKDYPDIEMED